MKIRFFKSLLFVCFMFTVFCVSAQKIDLKLEKRILQEIEGFQGNIGIYVKSLQNGKAVSISADSVFPTASIVKVPILLGIMNKIEKKELDYHQKLSWVDTLNYDPGEDIVAYLKPQTEIELSKVMMLMMTISDNTGSLWLQALAGSGSTINTLMDEWGFIQTKVNSRTVGREEIRKVYGWGQTTPREMAGIFEKIVNRELISPDACDRMLRIMGRQYWDEEALSSIPPTVYVASKNGAVNASRDEVLYVNGKHPYIFSVFTKNNKDVSWGADNEAWVLTRKLSKLVYEHFNR